MFKTSQWPKWAIIPTAFVITFLVIGISLGVEPLIKKISPTAQPTPVSKGIVPYAAPLSNNCTNCHTQKDILETHTSDAAVLERVWINPADLVSFHAVLGCVTCHGGDGKVNDVETAHIGIVSSPSNYLSADNYCLSCHENIRGKDENVLVKTPHDVFLFHAHEEEDLNRCSECHGQVAHGSQPMEVDDHISLDTCNACHSEQGVTEFECSSCHTDPHEIAETLACDSCHASTSLWKATKLSFDHPIDLQGPHDELNCFECHTWPDFQTLDGYGCADCHTPNHGVEDEMFKDCSVCHSAASWKIIEE